MNPILLIVAALAVAAPAPKPAAKPSFAATLAAFKTDKTDANRRAVIAAARAMKTRPKTPDEAVRFEGRAEYAFKAAKSAGDFAAAAAEYDKASDEAPWSSADYYNAGVAYEKAENPVEAKKRFELYLLAEPSGSDAVDVKKRLAGLEFAAEKAAGEAAAKGRVSALVKRLNAIYAPKRFSFIGGCRPPHRLFKTSTCNGISFNGEVECNQGCNGAEHDDRSYWKGNHIQGDIAFVFSETPEGKIKMTDSGLVYIGTPFGDGINQIRWNFTGTSKPTSVLFREDGSYLEISDSPVLPGEPGFDRNALYQYSFYQ